MRYLLLVLVALFATTASAEVVEEVVVERECPTGQHLEKVLISEAIPEVPEITEEREIRECKNVGYLRGIYCDTECTKKKKFGSKYGWVSSTTVVVVQKYVAGVPAVWGSECVDDEPQGDDDDDDVTPAPKKTPSKGGGACRNCDTYCDKNPDKCTVSEEEEPVEEEPEEDTSVPDEPLAAAKPDCPRLINGFITLGGNNDPADVTVLQNFLNLEPTGIYNAPTYYKLRAFQQREYNEVIAPWHNLIPGMGVTGKVMETTRHAINTRLCPSKNLVFPALSL